jgi:hypothetical protein
MKVTAAWVEWLRSLDWQYFSTLSFGYPVQPSQARRAVEEWLAPPTQPDPVDEGLPEAPRPQAYAALGLQRGPVGGLIHVHALVGGVRRVPLTETHLRGRWRKGDALVEGYRPRLGGVEYMVRQADVIELVGTPVPYRLRRRGRRARSGG